MIRLTEAAQTPCIVDVNYYVPLSFATHNRPLIGARYALLGNAKDQFIELQFPTDSLTLSGFTLLGCKTSSQQILSGQATSVVGLPEFILPEDVVFEGTKSPQARLYAEVCLSCFNGVAEVSIGTSKVFNLIVIHDRVQILLLDDILVGLRVLNLTDEERQTLSDYIVEHQSQSWLQEKPVAEV